MHGYTVVYYLCIASSSSTRIWSQIYYQRYSTFPNIVILFYFMVQAFTDKNRTSLLVYIFRSIPILVGICALVAKNNRCHLRFVCVDYCIQIGRFIRYTSQLIRPPFPDLLDRGNSLAECQHAASESTLFGWPDLMNVRVHRSRAPSSCVMYCASHRERVLSVTPGWPPPPAPKHHTSTHARITCSYVCVSFFVNRLQRWHL